VEGAGQTARHPNSICLRHHRLSGLDYCSLANARSIPIAQELTRGFANHETANSIGGCTSHLRLYQRCGHHHVRPHRHSRRSETAEFYQITIAPGDEHAESES